MKHRLYTDVDLIDHFPFNLTVRLLSFIRTVAKMHLPFSFLLFFIVTTTTLAQPLHMLHSHHRRALQARQDQILESSTANPTPIEILHPPTLRLQEEAFFKQKSRIRWLQEGDRNTKYFHHFVKKRQMHNRILSVTCDDGDRKSTRLNSSNSGESRMPSSA